MFYTKLSPTTITDDQKHLSLWIMFTNIEHTNTLKHQIFTHDLFSINTTTYDDKYLLFFAEEKITSARII